MARRRVFAGLLALAAVLLAGLGVWQVERLAWKRVLIATTDARLARAPVALPGPEAWPRIGDYTRVSLAGRWLTVAPAWVKAVTNLGPGWWMVSPLSTQRGTVLVNRGFVPADLRDRIAAPAGPARLTGLVRASEPGGAFLRRNDAAADRWFSRDVAAIGRARRLGAIAPFFVDVDRGGNGWPRGGMTVVRFPNNHLVYAATWFALALLALWFALQAWRRKGA